MPLSTAVDAIFHGLTPSAGDIGGAALLALGFAILVRADLYAEGTAGASPEEALVGFEGLAEGGEAEREGGARVRATSRPFS